MITLLQGNKKRFDIQGQSIKGIQFDGTLVRTSSTESLLDFSTVDVSIVLYQDGKEITICSGSLEPLAMASNFRTSAFSNAASKSSLPTKTGTSGSNLQCCSIDFGSVINLRSNDKMTVEVRVNTGFLPANTSSVASELVVSAVEGIGLQWITPKIQYQTIGAGESNFRQNIGDNTISLHYINTSETDNIKSTNPIKNARIFSDRYNVNDSLENLISKRQLQFQSYADFSSRNSSFELVNTEIDDCRIELDLVPANVDSGKNYIVWKTFETCEKQVQTAKRSRAKHQAKAVRKLRSNPRG